MRIALVNMPFAIVNLPSIALTQLRAELRREFGPRVEPQLLHVNHDCAEYLGLPLYEAITGSLDATVCALGDWFFREAAFPEEPDVTNAFFQRYPRLLLDQDEAFASSLETKRLGLDAFLDRVLDKYSLDEFPLVGFTSMFVQNVACFAAARKLKERNPSVITVMGGANCEAPMGTVIANRVDAIDFVFSGPALKSFPQFVRHILDGESRNCHRIIGVYSKQKVNKEHSPKEIGSESDINETVELHYDGFLDSVRSRWGDEVTIHLPFETSRGCWWGERAHCTFCGLNGSTMTYRAMKPEIAVEQLERLFQRYPGVHHYHAVDNILPREYLREMLPKIRAPRGATLFYEVKADLTGEQMAVLAQAGVREVQPGIEALATSTLRLMKKGTTAFQNITFLKHCARYGIDPSWNLLIGFPGETEDVYQKYSEDIPSLVHLPPPGGAFPVRFDRYSPYFTRPADFGLQLEPYDCYEIIYPFPRRDLEQLAYFFADQNYSAAYMQITAKWLRKLQSAVEKWRGRWCTDDGPPGLEIEQSDGGARVIDSRGSSLKAVPLDFISRRVLKLLENPLDCTRLARELSEFSAIERDRCLERLLANRLVFAEDGRFLSLVIEPASRPDWRAAELSNES